MTKNIVITVLICLLLYTTYKVYTLDRQVSVKTRQVLDVTNELRGMRNELGRAETEIVTYQTNIRDLKSLYRQEYDSLRTELIKRNIRIRDLMTRLEFEPTFNDTILKEIPYPVFYRDSSGIEKPIDTTIVFNDNFLDASIEIDSNRLSLHYMYSPGTIWIDIYRSRRGFLKPKETKTKLQFEAPHVNVSQAKAIVLSEPKHYSSITASIGYGAYLANSSVMLGPFIGLAYSYPIIKFYKRK